ncbi:MAG: YbaK/EbsC family protein [Actinomycetota bacterium]|nr:YbaK/EbsC family protein [Actinomycetota bacterium]
MLNQAVADFVSVKLPGARIVVSDDSTASSHQAAAAVGSEVARIGKSVVFVSGHRTAVVLISAAKRVSREKLRIVAGDPRLKVAGPETVTERTGYVVGGVSPLVVPDGVELYVDEALFELDAVWVSAGSPNSVVELSSTQMRELFGGRSFDLGEEVVG